MLSGVKGCGVAENNVRLVLAAAQFGAGETAMAQLCGTFNMPPVRGPTWAKANARVTAGANAAGESSRKRAREEERVLAFEDGVMPDGEGRSHAAKRNNA